MADPLAVAHASKVLEDHYFNYPGKYTIQQIINARGLTYREAPLSGSIGNIVFNESGGTITVSSSLSDGAQKRFTAAHELGHFENEKDLTLGPSPYEGEGRNWKSEGEGGKLEKTLSTQVGDKSGEVKGAGLSREVFYKCGFEDVTGLNRTSPREMSANDFAAELLMHKPWFDEFTKNKKLSLQLLSDCAEYFSVSLSAAAFRYAETGNAPCAIIMSTDGVVKWSSINKSFPYQFLRKGTKVHNMSYAFDLHKAMHDFKRKTCSYDQMKQKFAEVPKEDDIPAYAWFNEDFSLNGNQTIRIMEANIAMQNYNSVLTLLWEF